VFHIIFVHVVCRHLHANVIQITVAYVIFPHLHVKNNITIVHVKSLHYNVNVMNITIVHVTLIHHNVEKKDLIHVHATFLHHNVEKKNPIHAHATFLRHNVEVFHSIDAHVCQYMNACVQSDNIHVIILIYFYLKIEIIFYLQF